ncbi:MAG: hypothetical protein PSX81_02365 [bacterium]|nr:hypothetical protein [bacterium]
MQKYNIDIKFIDASNWQELSWFNSGGTRAKKVLQDPVGNRYYFKCSEKKLARNGKAEKYYKYEFWNEVIAYQLGKNLGLNILRYDVAVFDGEIGCLSPQMTIIGEEQLLEIGRFMTAINSDFLPEDNSTRNKYTFHLLEDTLEYFNIHKYWNFIFETLLFDTIIGNTDRHQENWAFIGKTNLVAEGLSHLEERAKNNALNWVVRKFCNTFLNKKNELNEIGKQLVLENLNISKTAPIYDSGSSMARELTEERIKSLLANEIELNNYIDNGKSELHWDNRKISHYDLIDELLNSSYAEQVRKASVFLSNWQPDLIFLILEQVNLVVPERKKTYCIPKDRKELIIKLVTLRINKLINLISAGV